MTVLRPGLAAWNNLVRRGENMSEEMMLNLLDLERVGAKLYNPWKMPFCLLKGKNLFIKENWPKTGGSDLIWPRTDLGRWITLRQIQWLRSNRNIAYRGWAGDGAYIIAIADCRLAVSQSAIGEDGSGDLYIKAKTWSPRPLICDIASEGGGIESEACLMHRQRAICDQRRI